MKAKYSYSFLLVLSILGSTCAHQDDDDYPVRHGSMAKPSEMPSPVVPPSAPSPVQSVPLVTLPPPPAPPISKPSARPATTPARTTPAPSPGATAGSSSSGTLQMNDPLSAPVKRLLSNAEESLKKGKILEARAQADRAYRMDLHDPRTSFMMARVSERERAYEDAEQWAMRSLENVSDPANKKVIWAFVNHCREKSGGRKGLQEATRRVKELKK